MKLEFYEIIKLTDGRWHIKCPDGEIMRRGDHSALSWANDCGAVLFCQYHGLPYQFDWQARRAEVNRET